ncbi:collagen alpha-3(VI) chain [Latimeria chalumnae]|uniref:collagen alpha-3(VI) chain n=1 Tax=Latimeria chalumnae TaxID=7897 RepID=UPI00313BA6D3
MKKHRHLPFLALFTLIFSGFHTTSNAQQTNAQSIGAADIIFLVDSSWSIGKENFQHVREFLYNVVKALATSENDFHFGLVQYSGNPHTEFLLNTYSSNQDILFHIWSMTYKGGGTKTGKGLEYLVKKHLTSAAGNRASDGVPQVIIVLTDGRSQDDVAPPSSALKSADINLFAIGVQDAVDWELKEIASEPLETHLYNLENFTALHSIVDALVANIIAAADPQMAEATGVIKDITAQESADLIFLIDGSTNVGPINFGHLRDFLVNFIDSLEVGIDKIRVGLVQYSEEPKTEFFLNSYATKSEVLDAVKALKFKGGVLANTGEALEFVVQDHLLQSAGSRLDEDVPQILVVISAGRSSDDIREGVFAVKQAGIYSLGIAVAMTDTSELDQIAVGKSFVYTSTNFRALDEVQEQMLAVINGVAQRTIILQPPTIIEETEVNRRDILFLIDGTDSVGSPGLIAIRDFIRRLVNRMEIGPGQIQVALAQYTDEVKPEFNFDTFRTKRDIIGNLLRLRNQGGETLNTGAALDYARTQLFVRDAGSRIMEGIPQLLVLFVAGPSADDITRPVRELKQAGILALTVGTGNADQAELESIAFSPSLVFEVQQLQQLTTIQRNILAPLTTLSGTIVTEGPTIEVQVNQRDIIFLLDGSSNVGASNFPYLREFVTRVINHLDIGSNRIQVGVVQYSETPRTDFYLNTYPSRDQMLAGIRQLQYKGGNIVNTGAALNYVLTNHFTRSAGSRIEERIPQLLVLVSAGRSADDYRQIPQALIQAGILTLCVGVGNAEPVELQQIAYRSDLVFPAASFSSLPDLQQQLLEPLMTYVPAVSTTVEVTKRDVLFLIDASVNVGGQFPSIREFLTKFTEQLDIGLDRTRVAMATYTDSVRVDFQFDTHSTKEKITSAIKRIRPRGGRAFNTGGALDYALKNIFISDAGSRINEGVPQFLILLAAGRSRDQVEEPAQALKQAGIVAFTIGAKNIEVSELQQIAYLPDFVVTVNEIRDMPGAAQQMQSLLQSVVIEEPTVIEDTEAIKRDVVFLIDGSDYVRGSFPNIQDFIQRVVETLDVGPDRVRVAVVQHSNDANAEFLLNRYGSKSEIQNAIRSMRLKGGYPINTGEALNFVSRNVFISGAGSRIEEDVPQILILLLGGRSSDDVSGSATTLKRAGVVPFGIGTRNADPSQLQTISISPDYTYTVSDFRELPTVRERLSSSLSRLSTEEIKRLRPTVPAVPDTEAIKRDVVFLIDGSDYVRGSFPYIQDFIQRVVETLDVGPDRVRVAVVQYSNDANAEFLLNRYGSKSEIQNAIRSMRLKGGYPINTGEALNFVSRNVFISGAGSRIEEDVPQILILLLGGRSSDDVSGSATTLKRAGVVPFGIGTRNADPSQLQTISISPDYTYTVSDFRELPTVRERLSSSLSRLSTEEIKRLRPTVPAVPDTEAIKRDVVFLIDGSDYVRGNFPYVQDFIQRVVETLDVGPDRVRVAVVQYSNDANAEFLLNRYRSKSEIQNAIRSMRLKGGYPINTGEALNFVSQNVFISGAGSRIEEDVPQILILLLGGRSSDDVSRSATTLKRAGVVPFGIGTRNADPSQLQMISISPDYTYTVSDFRELPTVQDRLSSSLSRLSTEEIERLRSTLPTVPVDTEAIKRDVVFLIDGSDYVRGNFPYVQDFIQRVVETLDVGPDRVRVAVVQYSNDANAEFLLNRYGSKSEIQNAIRSMRLKGGYPTNTGEALNFVSQNVFISGAGSRIEEDIPQILILLLGGRSSDDVSGSATTLKRAGVVPFGIGTRNADPSQLQTISISPDYTYTVSDFRELPTVRERLSSSLSRLSTEELKRLRPTVPAVSDDGFKMDLVFLVDGSDDTVSFFQPIQDFMVRVVETLDIGTDRIRVAVVQYSDDADAEFLLNEYGSKRDVVNAIRRTRHKGGDYCNTGEALNFVSQNVFTSGAGSRIEEGVLPFLVILAGGRSNDDVRGPATTLKRARVVPYAIGTRNADPIELQTISFTPDFTYIVSDFRELPTVQQRLSSSVTRVTSGEIARPTTIIITEVETDGVKRDVVFLIDGSDDVRSSFPSIRDFVQRVVETLDVGTDKVRVAVVQYSDDTNPEFLLNRYGTKREVVNAIRNMRHKGGYPLNTGEALNFVSQNVFTSDAGSRIKEDVPQFLILLAGGRSNDDVRGPSVTLKTAGVVPYGIGTRNADIIELQTLSFTPDFTYRVSDFRDLPTVQQRISTSISTLSRDEIGRIRPTIISVPADTVKRDVVFLIDGSNDARSTFPSIRDFVQRVVDTLDVGTDKVRVAVVQYSNDANPEFLLNRYGTKREVVNAIRNMRHKGGYLLNTGEALNFVLQNVFNVDVGSRIEEDVPQFLILLAGGSSRDDVRSSATALKKAGVVPYGIGTRNTDSSELQMISFSPDFAYTVSDFRELPTLQQKISSSISTLSREEIQRITPSVIPEVDMDGVKRDIVFLVDGSNNVVNEFGPIRELISRTVQDLEIGIDKARVAVVQYSDDVTVNFLLNAHLTKDELSSAIRRLRPKGGTQLNTGAALEYVGKNIFVRPAGSRIEEGVPQFLVVLTGGKSTDDVKEPAEDIKRFEIAPLTIATKNADREELRQISLAPQYSFDVTSLRELPSIQKQLMTPLQSLTRQEIIDVRPETPTTDKASPDGSQMDVVFLIDSSNNVGPTGIANIRDFIMNVIQNLDIGPDRVRVGLVQYTSDPRTEFYLKTHTTRRTLENAVRRIRLRGGVTLNTGRALEYVMTNHFVRSAGSRIDDGVPQRLVLLTGGRSGDDVIMAAGRLRDGGIKSLGIGGRNADISELQVVATNPRLVFEVRNFNELRNLQDRILASIVETHPVPEPPTPRPVGPKGKKADMVFLLDGSINFGRDNFNEVIQFVSGIIDAIFEDGDSIRVSLAQYNSDVTDEFFLKTYTTKDDIIDAISKVAYKGGRAVKTGAAIKHLQDNHFTKAAGSRIDERVPQIAFVITGGRSQDDSQTAAKALKSAGVRVFAVGVADANIDEMSKIASEGTMAFWVPNAQELSEVNEELLVILAEDMVGTLCPGVTEVSKDCKLEVLVGFDVSNVASGQNVFAVQRGLESKMDAILQRIAQMRPISCSSSQAPSVQTGILTYSSTGQVGGFDLTEYKTQLFEQFQTLRSKGPFVLTAGTLAAYLNKFKSTGTQDSIKVIIHLTDGLDDTVVELRRASKNLRDSGVSALILVGLEKVEAFEDVMTLDFGRGFRYNRPLKINFLDLDYELMEEIDNIAERECCGIPCKCSGHRGDRGLPGSIGPKGVVGEKGYRGYPGDEGGPGDRGLPGVNGTQGFQGCPGQRGIKGSRGYSGEKGQPGEIGLDGIDGEEGSQGVAGPPGDRGNPGRRGTKGAKGDRGDRGDLGLRGDPGTPGTNNVRRGPKGQKGEIGPQGDPGNDGTSGTGGPRGKGGSAGRRGPPGTKGEQGLPGPRGSAGEQGLRGPQGDFGPIGTPGLRGEQGLPGTRGPGGPAGSPGERGRIGPVGKKGEPGDPGLKGQPGPAGPRGEPGDDGRDGIGNPGLPGRKGDRGFPGFQGPKGEAGTRGTNGTLGPKGNRGRRGNAGGTGLPGPGGEIGYPGPSGLKGEQGKAQVQCDLVRNIKDKCPCCYGPKECPVFPTELAFAIDTSSGVDRNTFNEMKKAILRIVHNLTIAESNCPRGARVAILTYNNEVTTEVRFADSTRKKALIQQLQGLQILQTTKPRRLETAMEFVARNTFKRVRGGFLMRKVAIFFSGGTVRASPALNAAVMKLYDAEIFSLFLTNKDDRALRQALQINNTRMAQALVLPPSGAELNETIKKIMMCHVCVDTCDPDASCDFVPFPTRDRRSPVSDVDIDIVFIMDSSQSTTYGQFVEMKRYISYIIDQLEISPDPKASEHHARVAVLQHAPYEYETNSSLPPVKVDFSLTDYSSKEQMQEFLRNKMTQLEGVRAMGRAVEYAVQNIFETAPHPRNFKVLILMTTGENNKEEAERLHRTIVDAKCKGYFFVVIAIGKKVSTKDLSKLASEPNEVFFKNVDKSSQLHNEVLLRFGELMPKFITSENAFYLPTEVRKNCEWFQSDQPDKTPFTHLHKPTKGNKENHSSKPEKPTDGGAGGIHALFVTGSSATLRWMNPEPQHSYTYDVTVASVTNHSLILKKNITDTEVLVEGLTNGQQYRVSVKAYLQSQVKAIYKGIFSTKHIQPTAQETAPATLVASTDPLENPETDASDLCLLDFDLGKQCKDYQAVWFFDSKTGVCTQFWYGGCGGNANRFETESQCISQCMKPSPEGSMQPQQVEDITIAVTTDRCQLQKEEGLCRNFIVKWYYDAEKNSCTRFWYGGCGGNSNRFNTQDECEKTCVSVQMKPEVVKVMAT